MRGISFSSNRVGSVVEGGHPALKSARSRIYAPKYIRVVIFVARKDKFPSVSVNNARNGGIREETLVVWTLVELVNTVDAPHRRQVTEDDLVRADAYDRAVALKQSLNGHALLQARDVGRQPEVRDGGVPRAGDRRKRGEKEVVDAGTAEVE